MFKSQMKCQKILCFVALILAALLFVYAVGFTTSLYDLLFVTLDQDMGLDFSDVEGTQFFWELQTIVEYETKMVNGELVTIKHRTVGFVDILLGLAIADILLAVSLFATNTHKRRLYHVGNYVTTGAFAGFNVAVAVWMMMRVAYFEQCYRAVDQVALEAHCNSVLWKRPYTPDAPYTTFGLGYALGALLIVIALVVVLNLVWKIMLQKRENKLLNQSSVQEVAVNG